MTPRLFDSVPVPTALARPERLRATCAVLALTIASGCAPGLNWRDVRTELGELTVLLPCKPERNRRKVVLANVPVDMEALSCTAAGTVWGVTAMDVGDEQKVQAVLVQLRAARLANLSAQGQVQPGDADASASRHPLRIVGRMPDGTAVVDRFSAFSQGSRVFQATALGGEPSQDALDTFFNGLRPAQ